MISLMVLLRSRKPSRRDPLCFHCQRCAEKYLKGRLIEAGLPFTRTHDLEQLLLLCLPIELSRVRSARPERSYCGKHFPNATSSLRGPLSRIFRRSRAHTTFCSFLRKPIHVCASAITC